MNDKGRSNYSSTSHDDFSLPRKKILRGRKNFKHLFEQDAYISHSKYINLRYQVIDDTSFGCQMGFIVKKSLGKANKRNRMKRLLREAYRHHQYMLSDLLREAQMTLHGALMAKAVDLNFDVVEQNTTTLLEQVRKQLSPISSSNS